MIIAAVDMGGTSIKGALIRDGGMGEVIVKLVCRKNPLKSLIGFIDELVFQVHDNSGIIDAIAIASAGRIDSERGVVLYASPNIPNWTGTPLARILSERYKTPCFVLNDARAAALGEARIRNVDNLVMLTIGTGLGGGIIVDGKLIHGVHYEAGEIGHTILKPNGRSCNCGKRGCAEQYISMRVLHRYSGIKDRKQLLEMFQKQEERVIRAVERMCEDLAVLVDKLFLTLDPNLVVIGGGFSELGPYALEILRKKVEPYASRSLYNTSQIELSMLKNEAGMIGAAIYAQEKLSGVGNCD